MATYYVILIMAHHAADREARKMKFGRGEQAQRDRARFREGFVYGYMIANNFHCTPEVARGELH